VYPERNVSGEGIDEDPATGAAAGPLARGTSRAARIQFGDEIATERGAAVGRPSTLYARVFGDAEYVEQVEVGGHAAIVGRAEFTFRSCDLVWNDARSPSSGPALVGDARRRRGSHNGGALAFTARTCARRCPQARPVLVRGLGEVLRAR
jgi:hypothetical protein